MTVFIKYFISGSSAVILHFLVLISFAELLNISPILGSFFGFILGSLLNYLLQYHWTFKSTNAHRQSVTRYAIVTGTMLLLNLIIFQLALNIFNIDYKIAQLIATSLVFLSNFVINSRYTFK